MWNIFLEAIDNHFRFLTTEFGFSQTLVKRPIVVFDSDKLRLILYYDESRGCELDLGIRRLADAPTKPLSLSIGLLMRLKDNGVDNQGYSVQFPSTKEAIEVEVQRLARHTLEYGSELLRGDLTYFDRLEEIEKELAKKYGSKT